MYTAIVKSLIKILQSPASSPEAKGEQKQITQPIAAAAAALDHHHHPPMAEEEEENTDTDQLEEEQLRGTRQQQQARRSSQFLQKLSQASNMHRERRLTEVRRVYTYVLHILVRVRST